MIPIKSQHIKWDCFLPWVYTTASYTKATPSLLLFFRIYLFSSFFWFGFYSILWIWLLSHLPICTGKYKMTNGNVLASVWEKSLCVVKKKACQPLLMYLRALWNQMLQCISIARLTVLYRMVKLPWLHLWTCHWRQKYLFERGSVWNISNLTWRDQNYLLISLGQCIWVSIMQ